MSEWFESNTQPFMHLYCSNDYVDKWLDDNDEYIQYIDYHHVKHPDSSTRPVCLYLHQLGSVPIRGEAVSECTLQGSFPL